MSQSNELVKDTIVRLLGNMANQREIEQYLKRFSSHGQSRFAVIKVGGGIIKDDLENLCSSLTFLHRIGLSPIVIHGAGPQLTEKLNLENIENKFIDGSRVTTPQVLKVARKVFQKVNLQIVESLQNANVKANSISGGVFDSVLDDNTELGLVGKIQNVSLEPIMDSLAAGAIPVISSLGETDSGQIVNINADVATNELVLAVKPYKIIFLTQTGGLLDNDGNIIHSINLSSDYDTIIEEKWVSGGMKLKLQQAASILRQLPHSSSISITEPSHLAKELFTHRGSGTLIRRGEPINQYENWEDIDCDKLKTLIENSFKKKLDNNYFTKTKLFRAYITDSYRSAAILTQEHGITHLDKYAVADDAKGEGLGRAVWTSMRNNNLRMFWRSRILNPINTFYFNESDGCVKDQNWVVFWYGVTDIDLIKKCISSSRAREATIV